MKSKWNGLALAIAALASLLAQGCGGISADNRVSPGMFFLPGLGSAVPPSWPAHLAQADGPSPATGPAVP